jgi:hypothetical protein
MNFPYHPFFRLKTQGILMLLFCFPVLMAQARQDSSMVRYGPYYEFRDGIFMNIRMVRANRPIPFSRLVAEPDRTGHEFYKKVLSADHIALFNQQGVPIELETKELWGYAYQGEIHIQVGGNFHRLMLDGNISRFRATATTWQEIPDRPPNPGGYQPTTATYPYRRRPAYRPVTGEGKMYLLDFEKNVMHAYHPDALAELLKRDPELYREYSDLSFRKRKKSMLEYMQKYNNRHPLYFPATGMD